jgi:vancomycin resistance protein YoaR
MTSGDYYVPTTDQRSSGVNPWLVRVPLLIISGGFLFVVMLAGLVIGFQAQYADKIVPGMWSYGVNLSGMTRAQAAQALSAAFTYDQKAVFTFRYGDWFRQLSAGELGITFDVGATVEEAFTAGHSGSLLTDLSAQASIWLNGRSVPPIVKYDQNITTQKLNAIAAEFSRPPVDATINIAGNGTTVITTPSQTGLALDISSTLSKLEESLLRLDTGAEIQLTVIEAQPRIRDAEAAAIKMNTALSAPLTLVTEDPKGGTLGPWTASVEQIRSLLLLKLVENGDGTLRYDVEANPEPLRGFVESLAPGLIARPQDGRFHFDEASRQLQMIKDSVNGRELDVDATLQRVQEAIFNSGNRIVPLAFTYELPAYSSNVTAAELGITQLVGEATTYYTGSTQSRINNIIEGVDRMNGVIIAPGEEFSFNTYLGDISVEAGFVQGKIIFGGRTVEGVGGGICQVSTTLFRAALEGGFPITERNSHGYRVGFYEQNNQPPGLDAAIFQPEADFRFMNDTPYHLLIEASAYPAQQAIQFRLYSTNPGRQIVLEGPTIRDIVPAKATVYEANAELRIGQEQYVDWAKEGADVTFIRRILDASGQQIREDTIYTHYLPWAAVIQVAPGDPRLTQQTT